MWVTHTGVLSHSLDNHYNTANRLAFVFTNSNILLGILLPEGSAVRPLNRYSELDTVTHQNGFSGVYWSPTLTLFVFAWSRFAIMSFFCVRPDFFNISKNFFCCLGLPEGLGNPTTWCICFLISRLARRSIRVCGSDAPQREFSTAKNTSGLLIIYLTQ